jgi:hypothetical protein
MIAQLKSRPHRATKAKRSCPIHIFQLLSGFGLFWHDLRDRFWLGRWFWWLRLFSSTLGGTTLGGSGFFSSTLGGTTTFGGSGFFSSTLAGAGLGYLGGQFLGKSGLMNPVSQGVIGAGLGGVLGGLLF